MKEPYVHLERVTENVNKECFGKVDLKTEIKVEEHDLNDQTYNDDVSQSVFLLLDIINFRLQKIGLNFEVNLLKFTKCYLK